MGLLNYHTTVQSKASAGDAIDQVFAVEQAEKKLGAAKIRLELEISAWLENVSFHLTEIGNELVEEVGMTANQLLMQAREKGMMNNEGFIQDLDIKFAPRMLQRAELGFLSHGSILPTSLSLELVTRIGDISVGARVTLAVEAECMISPCVRNSLDLSVCTGTKEPVPCQEDTGSAGGRCLLYSFTFPSEGQYLVKATLYSQNISGSPLVIPVSESSATGLAQIGLAVVGKNSTTTSYPQNDSATLPQKIMVALQPDGSPVGGVVRHKIEKKFVRGVEVTFIDYNNSEFVQRESSVWSKEEVPEGAMLDPGGSGMVGVGDEVVAQWEEDGVWYNARVLGQEEGGYSVLFTDYGNEAFVEDSQIVKEVADILEGEALDINLQVLLDHDEPVKVEIVINDDLAATVEDIHAEQLNMLDENFQNRRTEHKTNKPLCRTNLDRPPAPVPRSNMLVKGSEIITKREEDSTWHRAVVHEVVALDRLYIVRYDYIGQYGGASPDSIVMHREDIPQGENIGQDVTVERAGWSVGDSCIALWSQDSFWYNGEVISVGVGGCYGVRFVDYGNADDVIGKDIVKTVMEIPDDSLVDENVDQTPEKPKVKSEVVDDPRWYEGIPEPKPVPNAPRPLKPESIDQARLLASSDYTAAVSCQEASAAAGCSHRCSVPASLQCCLCSSICRKGMRVACDSSAVCWGCAVKEITRGHVCWLCGQRNITTDSHLRKDTVLRASVEEFVNRSKLLPGYEEAIRISMYESPQSVPSVKLVPGGMVENDSCLAKCSEDGVWYNGIVTDVCGDGSAVVYFMDYGNSERVKAAHIVRGPEDIPEGDQVDQNVQLIIDRKLAPSSQTVIHPTNGEPLSFLCLSTRGDGGLVTVTAKETLSIKDLKGPIGVTVLGDGSLAVVCRGANCVSRYDMEGVFLGVIRPGREFVKPSDILTLASGEFVVRDDRGIQLFGRNLQFVKFVAEDWIDRCFGLAEDDEGRIITINCNTSNVDERNVKITLSNKTDVFFIDKISNTVIKRIEMEDLIEDAVEDLQALQADMSACRFLSYHNKKLYVVDFGLDCVFILDKDGTESELFGSRGNKGGEFRDPAGLAVDDIGTMMVVDSRNHRLQLINSDLNFAGMVKVDTPLARPSGIFVDRENGDITVTVSNYLGNSVVRYKLSTK